MKIYIALIVAMGIFLGGATVGTAAPPTTIPGDIFEGDYLRIGINYGGTLGVSSRTSTVATDPGVGFQWIGDVPFVAPPGPPHPIPTSTESLAIWFWGEGYKIAYKEFEPDVGWVDTVAYWQPNASYPPPPATNIILVSNRTIIDDEQKAVKEVVVRTKDSKLLLTFTFTFLKQYPELNLETTIKNNGTVPLRDIVYTRYVDWDVCTNKNNTWASTSHEAFAWGPCMALGNNTIQLTVEGNKGVFRNGSLTVDNSLSLTWPLFDIPLPIVNYIDLWAWDDALFNPTARSPLIVNQSFAPQGPVDFNAGVYYKIDELNPRKSKTVYTVYQSNFPNQSGVIPTPTPPSQP